MENLSILKILLSNIDLLISVAVSLVFLIVNIILAIKNKDKSKLKEALLCVPQVISNVEAISKKVHMDSIEKKAMAEVLLKEHFGSIYTKNYQLFDDAIEDILSTPQKKGGSDDVSKEN